MTLPFEGPNVPNWAPKRFHYCNLYKYQINKWDRSPRNELTARGGDVWDLRLIPRVVYTIDVSVRSENIFEMCPSGTIWEQAKDSSYLSCESKSRFSPLKKRVFWLGFWRTKFQGPIWKIPVNNFFPEIRTSWRLESWAFRWDTLFNASFTSDHDPMCFILFFFGFLFVAKVCPKTNILKASPTFGLCEIKIYPLSLHSGCYFPKENCLLNLFWNFREKFLWR